MAGDVVLDEDAEDIAREIVPVYDVGAHEHELRQQGKSWPAIAKELGHVSGNSAQRARERYLQRAGLELSKEKREQALGEEIERLDTLQVGFWEAATLGWPLPGPDERTLPDVKAAEVILKIITLRSRLLGLEEPDTSGVSVRTVLVTGDTEQYVATLKKLIAGDVVDADVVEDE